MPPTSTAVRPRPLAELIVELSRLALAATDVPGAVHPILDALVDHTAAEGAAYFQRGSGAFLVRTTAGRIPTGDAMGSVVAHGLPADAPLLRALERASAPLFFADTSADETTVGFPDLGVCSVAAAPVVDADARMIGAFLMHTFEPHEWGGRDADLFAAIAGTLAMLTARLVAEERLAQSQEGALRALGLALEYRDGETKGHTDRVAALCMRLGAAMGLDADAMRDLRWGAYLHDVGKISVPDALLRKPGPLTKAEWSIMHEHPAAGLAFAERLGFLPAGALEVIHAHHERWDGGGYPRGLAREEVPLGARIFAVCDVYDALVSPRPYKEAWPDEQARDLLSDGAGSQFDPAVVDAFLALPPEE